MSSGRIAPVSDRSKNISSLHGKDVYRVVVMGAAMVGKTCIIKRFLHDEFACGYHRTIEDLYRGEFDVAGNHLLLDIIDTAGSYAFPAMKQLGISTGDTFILVYSVGDMCSFDKVRTLRQQIIGQKGEHAHTPIII